jgi:hypothetical protein
MPSIDGKLFVNLYQSILRIADRLPKPHGSFGSVHFLEGASDKLTGPVCQTGDAAALTAALRWIHDHEADLPKIGARGRVFVEPYSATQWTERVCRLCRSVPL